MKKILVSVNCLKDIGGIGTAAINLLNEIHKHYDVTLCVPSNFISEKYSIPSEVKVIHGSSYLRDVIIDRNDLSDQNIFQRLRRNIRRVFYHYIFGAKAVEKALKNICVDGEYDVAIAFADYAYSSKDRKCFDYFVVLNNVRAKKKVAWMHNDPQKLGWTRDLVKSRMSDFDVIVNVSSDCKRILDEMVPEFEPKSKVVYNMYDIQKIRTRAESVQSLYADNGKIHFVTVARIQVLQKRIDRIIEVCRRLKLAGYSNFDWTLVGSGADMDTFMHQVECNELQEFVRFVGLQTNPYPYMKQADAFVLSSDYEGFGMTVKEAQILNVPTFVTNFGPANETMKIGKQGEICENSTDGLFSMIQKIVQHPEKLSAYREFLMKHPVDNSEALTQFDGIVSFS